MSVMKTAILSNGAPCMLEAAVKSAGIGGLRAPRQARLPVIGQRLADRLPLELVRGRLVLEEGDDCGDLFRRKSGESLPAGIKQGELSIPPRIDRRVPCLIRKWGGKAASSVRQSCLSAKSISSRPPSSPSSPRWSAPFGGRFSAANARRMRSLMRSRSSSITRPLRSWAEPGDTAAAIRDPLQDVRQLIDVDLVTALEAGLVDRLPRVGAALQARQRLAHDVAVAALAARPHLADAVHRPLEKGVLFRRAIAGGLHAVAGQRPLCGLCRRRYRRRTDHEQQHSRLRRKLSKPAQEPA